MIWEKRIPILGFQKKKWWSVEGNEAKCTSNPYVVKKFCSLSILQESEVISLLNVAKQAQWSTIRTSFFPLPNCYTIICYQYQCRNKFQSPKAHSLHYAFYLETILIAKKFTDRVRELVADVIANTTQAEVRTSEAEVLKMVIRLKTMAFLPLCFDTFWIIFLALQAPNIRWL